MPTKPANILRMCVLALLGMASVCSAFSCVAGVLLIWTPSIPAWAFRIPSFVAFACATLAWAIWDNTILKGRHRQIIALWALSCVLVLLAIFVMLPVPIPSWLITQAAIGAKVNPLCTAMEEYADANGGRYPDCWSQLVGGDYLSWSNLFLSQQVGTVQSQAGVVLTSSKGDWGLLLVSGRTRDSTDDGRILAVFDGVQRAGTRYSVILRTDDSLSVAPSLGVSQAVHEAIVPVVEPLRSALNQYADDHEGKFPDNWTQLADGSYASWAELVPSAKELDAGPQATPVTLFAPKERNMEALMIPGRVRSSSEDWRVAALIDGIIHDGQRYAAVIDTTGRCRIASGD